MYSKLTTNLMVKDVQETLHFYKEILGFDFVMAVPKEQDCVLNEHDPNRTLVYALVKSKNIEIMFQEQTSLSRDISIFEGVPIAASICLYFEVSNVVQLYEKLKSKVEIVKDLDTTWYEMKEFYIKDNNGYILGFAEQVNES